MIIYNFNAYDDNEKLVGLTGEVTLPSLELMGETTSGAGILGEIEITTPNFSSMQMELTWQSLFEKAFDLLSYSGRTLTLRAAQQSRVNGQMAYKGLKVAVKFLPKTLDLGKLAINSFTETKNTLEVTYIKIEIDGKTIFELDKENSVYVVNGKDMLADIRNLL